MEQYIDKLSLSSEIKLALRNIHITKVSDLDGLDYLTLAEKFPKGYNVTAIANELNSLGYLYPPENEISVYDISMSKRLQNALERVLKPEYCSKNAQMIRYTHEKT